MIGLETEKLRDNRAVTPLFRGFGGCLKTPAGDAVRLSGAPAGHRGEWRVLALMLPLVLGAAIFDGLWRLGGGWLAVVGVLPALFAALHLLAIALGGKRPDVQYRRWELLLTLWAVALFFFSGRSSGVLWAAWLWAAFLVLQMMGQAMLAWRVLMGIPGRQGLTLRWGLALAAHAGMALVWWRWGWPAGAACGAAIATVGCAGTLIPDGQLFGRVATRHAGRGVLLTFDDGPHPTDTPAILELLDRYGRKAVFFVIGEKVREFPELAREIVRRGHELGNHTLTHPQATMWCAGESRTQREIEGCSAAIREITGEAPRWFRAPVGHRNFFTHPIAAALGMEVVAWSRRAYDTIGRDVPGMVRTLTEGAGDGDILLLHEGTPVAIELAAAVLEELEKCRVISQCPVASKCPDGA